MIYFDITDLFDYLRKNRNVTGIQRVQTKILHALANQSPEQIRCLVINATARSQDKIKLYRAEDLFANEQNITRNIKSILKQSSKAHLLDPAGIRSALQPYSDRKLYRGLKKVELYACRLLAPHRLAELGYQEEVVFTQPIQTAQFFDGPKKGDLYVLLGHNWSTPGIDTLAQAFRSAGGKAVQVIHDVIPAIAPDFFPAKAAKNFKEYLDRCSNTFDAFITVSEHTRKDLLSYFGRQVNATSIKVLRLAHAFGDTARNAPYQPTCPPNLTALTDKPFVVSVGTIEPRKNHTALIRVWSRLHHELRELTPTLVIAGKLGWKTDAFTQEIAAAIQQGVPIMHITSADDKDLHFLYAQCLFSIYPSQYEGWGLPVGESLWLGRPCLASNASSIPEIADKGVAYFDPLDESDMFTKVRHLCVGGEQLTKLAHEAKSAALSDWSHVASNLMKILKSFKTKT